MVFGGKAGGWPSQRAIVFGEVRGLEFVPIDIHIDDDLATWRVEIPGKVEARMEALGGPTTLPGQRVQLLNPPGCEIGPNGVATWGVGHDPQRGARSQRGFEDNGQRLSM